MAYVQMPKDLSNVEPKLFMKMTRNQLKFNVIGIACGLAFFFITKPFIGTMSAVYVLLGTLVPFFMLGMYKKHGKTATELIRIRLAFDRKNKIRVYKTENIYGRMNKIIEERK